MKKEDLYYYWTDDGKKTHAFPDCPSLRKKMYQCWEAATTETLHEMIDCRRCGSRLHTDSSPQP